jgi:hypothetical protein
MFEHDESQHKSISLYSTSSFAAAAPYVHVYFPYRSGIWDEHTTSDMDMPIRKYRGAELLNLELKNLLLVKLLVAL